MQWVFLALLSHKLNVIFHISTYSTWEFSNPTDTSAKNVTCGGFTELVELNYLCIYTLYYFGLKAPSGMKKLPVAPFYNTAEYQAEAKTFFLLDGIP